MISETTVIKYLDLLLINIEDISSFNSYKVLYFLPNIGDEVSQEHFLSWAHDLHNRVKGLAFTYGYIENVPLAFSSPEERLTPKGIEARKLGGHTAYESAQTVALKLKERKDQIDLKLSNWKVRSFWFVFGFGAIGFVLSVYNFINDKSSLKQLPQLEQQLERVESEVEKLHNEILIRKNLDSSHNSKVLNGSEIIVEPQGN